MSDRDLVIAILRQINQAIDTIKTRTRHIQSSDDFTASSSGREKLDSVCMLFMAIGEALKKVDKLTERKLLARYPKIDWIRCDGVSGHHRASVL